MPVWFTFLVSVFATVFMLGGAYAAVIAIIEGRRAKASPRIGIAPGKGPGTLSCWVSWNPGAFAVQVYRIRVNLFHPHGKPQEGMFSVSYDPVQKAPFLQTMELPKEWMDVVEGKASHDAILTFDFRTVEELTLAANYKLATVRKIYKGKQPKLPSGLTELPIAKADVPSVMTLDYQEWNARKKKLKDLEAAAKAKAASKPAAAPAAAKPAAPPAPSASAPAAKPVETPEAAPPAAAPAAPGNVPSVKEMIAKENAKKKEAVKTPS